MVVTLYEDGEPSRQYPLGDKVLRIGRSRENEIFVADPYLSRFHAQIACEAGVWTIVDRNSKHGTSVNDSKISTPVPLKAGDRITCGRTTLIFGPPREYTLVASPTEGSTSERTIGSIRVAEEPETALSRLLVDAARQIASHRSSTEILRGLLQLAMRATGAERGLVARRAKGGVLVPVVWETPDGIPPVISRHVLARVVEGGEALSLEDLPEDLASQGTIVGAGIRSILCAPLGVERPYSGVFYIDSLLARANFRPQHLEVLMIVAGMADVVLENARTREEREALKTMEAQLQAAAEIQTALLPPANLVTATGYCAAGFHRACQTVGGDFFDFFHRGEQLGVMLADVAGKGLGAALLMANLHARWHGVRLLGLEPDRWLGQLNDDFQRCHPGNRFITMAFALADPGADQLVFASAGHNPAVLVADGAVELLDSTGPILGIIPQQEFGASTCRFPRGARLVLYSDGVTDQQNVAGEPFGLVRLADAVRSHQTLPADQLLLRLREEVEEFAGEAPQDDDSTIVVLGRD